MMKHLHPANIVQHENRTLGDRVADNVSTKMGSWTFIIAQAVITTIWVTANTLHGWEHWDSYPFVLLNLVYSFQAGFTGPVVLLSQNRQTEHDRNRAEADFKHNMETLELQRQIAVTLGISDLEIAAVKAKWAASEDADDE